MNPFKLKTKAEVEEEIRKVREIRVDEECALIFGLGDELVDLIQSQPTREEPVRPPRELTKSEAARLDAELVFETVFDEPLDPLEGLREPFRKIAEEQQRDALEAIVGPSRRAEARSEELVSQEVERQLRLSVHLGRLPGRRPDTGSERLLRYLKAYGEGDAATMRDVVRELLTTAA
jgi:hypothetical protein